MSLADHITAHLETPFAWGIHDCVLFAANWVRAATGRDPLLGLGTWHDRRSAVRAMRAAGGLQAALDARFPRVNPNFAKNGDLALYRGRICLFSGAYLVGPGMDGLAFIKRTEAECAWSL